MFLNDSSLFGDGVTMRTMFMKGPTANYKMYLLHLLSFLFSTIKSPIRVLLL